MQPTDNDSGCLLLCCEEKSYPFFEYHRFGYFSQLIFNAYFIFRLHVLNKQVLVVRAVWEVFRVQEYTVNKSIIHLVCCGIVREEVKAFDVSKYSTVCLSIMLYFKVA